MTRLDDLIAKLERDELTPADVRRAETLIALDLAAAGDRFVEAFAATQQEADEAIAET